MNTNLFRGLGIKFVWEIRFSWGHVAEFLFFYALARCYACALWGNTPRVTQDFGKMWGR